jgi:hypothetical protein
MANAHNFPNPPVCGARAARNPDAAVLCDGDLLKNPCIHRTGNRDLDAALVATARCLVRAQRIMNVLVPPPASTLDELRRKFAGDPVDVRTQAYLVPQFLRLRREYRMARRRVKAVAPHLGAAQPPGRLVRGWLDPLNGPSQATAHHAALALVRQMLRDCFQLWEQARVDPAEEQRLLGGHDWLDSLLERSAAACRRPRPPSALRHEVAAFLQIFPQLRSVYRGKPHTDEVVRRLLAQMTQEAARAWHRMGRSRAIQPSNGSWPKSNGTAADRHVAGGYPAPLARVAADARVWHTPQASPRPGAKPPAPDGIPGAPELPTGVPLAALLSAPDLARQFGLPVDRVESALRRFRKDHPDCFTEVENPRKNEPRYLYRTAEVCPVLQRLSRDG